MPEVIKVRPTGEGYPPVGFLRLPIHTKDISTDKQMFVIDNRDLLVNVLCHTGGRPMAGDSRRRDRLVQTGRFCQGSPAVAKSTRTRLPPHPGKLARTVHHESSPCPQLVGGFFLFCSIFFNPPKKTTNPIILPITKILKILVQKLLVLTFYKKETLIIWRLVQTLIPKGV